MVVMVEMHGNWLDFYFRLGEYQCSQKKSSCHSPRVKNEEIVVDELQYKTDTFISSPIYTYYTPGVILLWSRFVFSCIFTKALSG